MLFIFRLSPIILSSPNLCADDDSRRTLMALREPLNSMLWEETSVHTGLSWARMVLTFCRVWMSHTCRRKTQKDAAPVSPAAHVKGKRRRGGTTYNDGAVRRAAVQPVAMETERQWGQRLGGWLFFYSLKLWCLWSYPWMHRAKTMPSCPSRVF